MPSAVLVVDDRRTFPDFDGVYARTSREALAALAIVGAVGGSLDAVWLDHDLGLLPDGSRDDIDPVLGWLRERIAGGQPLPIGKVLVLASDPGRSARILWSLGGHYTVRRIEAGGWARRAQGALGGGDQNSPGHYPTEESASRTRRP